MKNFLSNKKSLKYFIPFLSIFLLLFVIYIDPVNAKIDSTNYSIIGDTLDSGGGVDSTSSATYDALLNIGSPFSGVYDSTSFKAQFGFNYDIDAPKPHAPTLQNTNDYYDKLEFILSSIDRTENDSDTLYAVAITSASDWSDPTKILFVQDDYSAGASLGIEDYMDKVDWGDSSGILITGLDPLKDYRVRVSALKGDFTGTDWGEEATATTSVPYVNFSIDSTTSKFGVLNPASVSTASPVATIEVNTNVDSGYTLQVASEGNGSLGGLYNSTGGSIVQSNTATLVAGSEGYGIQAYSSTANIATTYDKSGNDVGGLTHSLQDLADNNTRVLNEQIQITTKAAISGTTIGGNYVDVLTYFISTNF